MPLDGQGHDPGVPASYQTHDVPLSHAVTEPSNAVPVRRSAAAPAAAGTAGPGARRGSRRIALALAAAVAILGSVIGLVVTCSPHHPAPSHTAKAQLRPPRVSRRTVRKRPDGHAAVDAER